MDIIRLRVVGTSHVAKESQDKIKTAFAEFSPDIIAIELDRQRFYALSNNAKSSLSITDISRIGITGFIFAIIGKLVQKHIGKLVGVIPGEEMLLGARLAKNNKLALALIDQEVSITLKLGKEVKFSEKMKIVWDILSAPFRKQEKISIDLNKVPSNEIIDKMMLQLEKRYPGFHKVLLADRNKFMAKKLFLLLKNNPDKKILAIVGAGHEKGMTSSLEKLVASNLI
ncbi:TraB domain-containing protein [Candidatus Woesearchaeota archaeon]|nr:TraB domain-containing protein [Candidatus Woesearchaeota archaeon]